MPGDLPARQPTHEELELAKAEDQHGFDFAMRNLELFAQDKREERELYAGNRRVWFIIVLALIGSVSIFFISALYMNKDALLLDMLKMIAGACGGGGIGYIYGFRRGRMPGQAG